ncbi:hypothetical protein [Actinokineospora inagensis]|uniref:hypothetical protein n=1 Tax=Actinokineospora inagensis TaxID=103730 RepID=UPI0003F8E5A5|nr:hypothetical protein [Actinokineospora inagensis]
MRPSTDEGTQLNAEFTTKPDRDTISLFLESAGGSKEPARNHEYPHAIRLLARRLGALSAVVVSAVVESKDLADLPEEQRTIIATPWRCTPMSTCKTSTAG